MLKCVNTEILRQSGECGKAQEQENMFINDKTYISPSQ